MSNANLIALQNAILTNTLSADQQGALSTALGEIIPLFPGVDERSNAAPYTDEEVSQTWIAALFSLAAGGGSPMVLPVRVVSPPEAQLSVPFQPTSAGKLLLVADVTPQFTGLLLVSINLALIEDATGTPAFAIFFVDDLTAVTGGTEVAPGLIGEPTSTTPAFGSGVPIMAVQEPSFAGSAPHQAILTAASVPVQAVVGHRTGIVVVATDTSTQNWTAITAMVSVVELTNAG